MTGDRNQILGSIRRSLGVTGGERPRVTEVEDRLSRAPRGVVPARGALPPAERVALFKQMVVGAQGTVAEVASPDQVPAAVAEFLRNHNLAPAIRRGPDPRLETMPWGETNLEVSLGRSHGEDAVGVSHAAAGVAETGTLVLLSGPENPTTLNFLPDTHIVVVNAADVAGDYESVWEEIRGRYGKGEMPRTVNLVTGPSRSGDIEQKLLLGAHGPRQLHVLVVG